VHEEKIEKKSIMAFCCNCGLVLSVPKAQKRNNWLNCIRYEGPETQEPKHYVIDNSGEVYWVDANDEKLTRTKFAYLHGVDPWTIYCSRAENKDEPICKGFENRCKKISSPDIKPLNEEDDISPVKIKPHIIKD
jgi:hypothetical protein